MWHVQFVMCINKDMIVDNISETILDIDVVTTGSKLLTGSDTRLRPNSSKCDDFECPWRSFPYCKPFQVRYFVFAARRVFLCICRASRGLRKLEARRGWPPRPIPLGASMLLAPPGKC